MRWRGARERRFGGIGWHFVVQGLQTETLWGRVPKTTEPREAVWQDDVNLSGYLSPVIKSCFTVGLPGCLLLLSQ